MKTLEEILAPLEELRAGGIDQIYSVACIHAVPDLIAVRDGMRKALEGLECDFGVTGVCSYLSCAPCILKKLLGTPLLANPKPAAEEPRT